MLKKVKNDSGSVLSLVLIAMVLVSMTIMMVFGQVNNQIKTNSKREDNIEAKINAESQIEYGIAEYLDKIRIDYKVTEEEESEIDQILNEIVKMYLQEAINIHIHHDRNWNKNPNNSTEYNINISEEVGEILDNYDSNSLAKNLEIIEAMYKKINTNANDTDNKRPCKVHIGKAIEYIKFIQNKNVSIADIKTMIDYHRNELRNDLNLESVVKFNNNDTTIAHILDNIISKYEQSSKQLKDSINAVTTLINNWKDEFVTNQNNAYGLGNYGDAVSNKVEYKVNIAKQRLKILQLELKLYQYLKNTPIKEIANNNDVNIYIPSTFTVDGLTMTTIIDRDKLGNLEYVTQQNNEYKLKANSTNQETSTIPVKITSIVDKNTDEEYQIDAEIEIQIIRLVSDTDYEMNYNITKWNE